VRELVKFRYIIGKNCETRLLPPALTEMQTEALQPSLIITPWEGPWSLHGDGPWESTVRCQWRCVMQRFVSIASPPCETVPGQEPRPGLHKKAPAGQTACIKQCLVVGDTGMGSPIE